MKKFGYTLIATSAMATIRSTTALMAATDQHMVDQCILE